MKEYSYTVSMPGYESVSGKIRSPNAYVAQIHALMKFENANDLYFRDVSLMDRLSYFLPQVWPI